MIKWICLCLKMKNKTPLKYMLLPGTYQKNNTYTFLCQEFLFVCLAFFFYIEKQTIKAFNLKMYNGS